MNQCVTFLRCVIFLRQILIMMERRIDVGSAVASDNVKIRQLDDEGNTGGIALI